MSEPSQSGQTSPDKQAATDIKKPRRFAVEPVETSSRSSKDSSKQTDEPPKPTRRFAPQPIETSTRSSRDVSEAEAENKSRRRFAPEPVETTSRSSRDAQTKQDETARRLQLMFAKPKPVEKSTPPPAALAAQQNDTAARLQRMFAKPKPPEPVEETFSEEAFADKPRRRFAPQPIETTSSSSRQRKEVAQHDSSYSSIGSTPATPRRRFAPEPIETTSFSNRSSPGSVGTNRTFGTFGGGSVMSMDSAPMMTYERDFLGRESPPERPRRKFAPQLIETARRSRRQNSLPALEEADKSEEAGADVERRSRAPRRDYSGPPTLQSAAQRRIAAQDRGGTKSRSISRKHSYQVPRLDSIESSESDESPPPPSLFHSRSTRGEGRGSDTSEDTRRRASDDGGYPGYLLDLAAEAAERQLREQAEAAYPNANTHEPVEHYVDIEEEEELRGRFRADPTRRDSSDEKLAYEEMRNAAAKRLGNVLRKDPSKPKEPWPVSMTPMQRVLQPYEPSQDMKRMLEAARPPMLGKHLGFIRCQSPEHARFDVTQGAEFLKQQMCYLTQETTHTVDEHGLWAKRPSSELHGKSVHEVRATKAIWGGIDSSTTSRANTRAGSKGGGGGLWGGLCTHDDPKGLHSAATGLHTPNQTPLATPYMEKDDPFSMNPALSPAQPTLSVNNISSITPSLRQNRAPSLNLAGQSNLNLDRKKSKSAMLSPSSATLSPSPTTLMTPISAKLELEARLTAEFSDSFITQVYNYLSLGYPSLAWKFDEELSRVTKIPVEELRQDDKLPAGPRGHIRLDDPELDFYDDNDASRVDLWLAGVPSMSEGDQELRTSLAKQYSRESRESRDAAVVEESMCRRWRALRRYVREWGRQMFKNGEERVVADVHEAWGNAMGRRGSWGI